MKALFFHHRFSNVTIIIINKLTFYDITVLWALIRKYMFL